MTAFYEISKMDNIVTIRSLPCPTFCFTTFSVYQTNGVMIREGNGRGLIKVITRYLFDWLEKVTINVRTSCIQAVTGLERYCYTSMSGHILGWVHTCNITAYRNTVSWQCGRGSWPRNVSKVGYAVTSVFGPSHQRDDTVMAGAGVDVQRHVARPHLLRP